MMHWTRTPQGDHEPRPEKGACRVAELMQHLGVSDETVRRDLEGPGGPRDLSTRSMRCADAGLQRARGPFAARTAHRNAQAKRVIAGLVATEGPRWVRA